MTGEAFVIRSFQENREGQVMRARRKDAGFILPLAVMLVLMLAISGTSFMHHDYLERVMTMRNVDNHGSFYLANAGIERARETFKIPQPSQSWTTILNGSNPSYPEEQPSDPNFSALLCPDTSRGCVIPPFQTPGENPVFAAQGWADGDPVLDPDFPFLSGLFDAGQYEVRAFNDEPSLVDTNKQLIFRALGAIRGEQKLIEFVAVASLNAGWANCQGTASDPCPDQVHKNADIDHLDGREPRTYSTLPAMDPAYYSNAANFPWTTTTLTCSSGINCSGSTITLNIANDTFYLIDGLANPSSVMVNVDASGNRQDVVIFSEAPLHVQGNDHFNNAIFISLGSVQLQGNVTLVAPTDPMYPAIISGGNVGADNSVEIFGDIYASGVIDFRPLEIHGMLVGTDIILQSAATTVTDDGNEAYYGLFEGFTYPKDWLGNEGVANGWREIQ
jgi:hypothetical protein